MVQFSQLISWWEKGTLKLTCMDTDPAGRGQPKKAFSTKTVFPLPPPEPSQFWLFRGCSFGNSILCSARRTRRTGPPHGPPSSPEGVSEDQRHCVRESFSIQPTFGCDCSIKLSRVTKAKDRRSDFTRQLDKRIGLAQGELERAGGRPSSSLPCRAHALVPSPPQREVWGSPLTFNCSQATRRAIISGLCSYKVAGPTQRDGIPGEPMGGGGMYRGRERRRGARAEAWASLLTAAANSPPHHCLLPSNGYRVGPAAARSTQTPAALSGQGRAP